jgi:hypothetical protein
MPLSKPLKNSWVSFLSPAIQEKIEIKRLRHIRINYGSENEILAPKGRGKRIWTL